MYRCAHLQGWPALSHAGGHHESARLFEAAQRMGNTQKLESGHHRRARSIHRPGAGSCRLRGRTRLAGMARRQGPGRHFRIFSLQRRRHRCERQRASGFERLDSGRGRQEKRIAGGGAQCCQLGNSARNRDFRSVIGLCGCHGSTHHPPYRGNARQSNDGTERRRNLVRTGSAGTRRAVVGAEAGGRAGPLRPACWR